MVRRFALLFSLAALAALAAGCGKDDPAAISTDPVNPAQVNQFVNSLPDWVPPSDVEDPPVDLGDAENF
ncbi:MAG TPA: hypothetical protein VFX92_02310, partial [Candidatus Krumholzibacteria bacterium]|nr:hypothetical protein [Candidatus Krumholzibacteria bacterium]